MELENISYEGLRPAIISFGLLLKEKDPIYFVHILQVTAYLVPCKKSKIILSYQILAHYM
jgi:hypothetical protein